MSILIQPKQGIPDKQLATIPLKQQWTPRELTGAWMWLRADLGVTLSSSKVSTWSDQCGASGFSQSDSTKRPTIDASAVNGKPAVHYVTGDYLQQTSFTGPSGGGEIFAVLKVTAGYYAQWAGLGSPTSGLNLYPYWDGHIYDATGCSTRPDMGTELISLAAWHVLNVRTAAGARSLWLNDLTTTPQYSAASNTVTWPSTAFLGKGDAATFPNTSSWCAEIIGCGALGTAERARVATYLAARYGIAVS